MWICLNNAFFSIVEPGKGPTQSSELLLVRARRPGDIERVFPSHKAETIARRDYQFRAHIPRDEVAAAMANAIKSINYGNFKDSVKDDALHGAYGRFWHVMAGLQPQSPYSDYRAAPMPRRRPMPKKAEPTEFFGGDVTYPEGL